MKKIINNFYYWGLDYLYVARKQLNAFFDHTSLDQYRTKGGQTVILIPGVYESWHFMQPIAKMLSSKGYDVRIIDGLGYNRGSVENMAEIVRTYIAENKLKDIAIVAHSKGGLIGKYLLSIFKGTSTVKVLIALNTPFSGSRYAYLIPHKPLRVFAPTSKLLLTLAEDSEVNNKIVSIYSAFDPHIPGGSKLDGAKNIQLKTYGHFRIMNSPEVHSEIIKNIEHR